MFLALKPSSVLLIEDTRIENPCVGGSIPPQATKEHRSRNANPRRLALSFLEYTVLVSGPFPVQSHARKSPHSFHNACCFTADFAEVRREAKLASSLNRLCRNAFWQQLCPSPRTFRMNCRRGCLFSATLV